MVSWVQGGMTMIVNCGVCNKEFTTYPAHIKRGAGKHCSYSCMGISRQGRATYIRTPEHNAKMSQIVSAKDQTLNRERFLEINKAKKGKTIRELYPDKAEKLLERYKYNFGEGNPNWKGGKHRNRYPYIFFQLRPSIIERDGYTCQNCGITDVECRQNDSLGRGLTVHHIDYDKENNKTNNLITLCRHCNSRANSRRNEWQTKYAQKLLGQ